jgi:hypothetical protein
LHSGSSRLQVARLRSSCCSNSWQRQHKHLVRDGCWFTRGCWCHSCKSTCV